MFLNKSVYLRLYETLCSIQLKCTFETKQKIIIISYHPTHQHGHTNFWYVCRMERACSYNLWYAYTKWSIRPEPRSSGGNTPSNPQVSVLIPWPASNGVERMCRRHGSNQNSHHPILVQKLLRNQFIHYHISSRVGFWYQSFPAHDIDVCPNSVHDCK